MSVYKLSPYGKTVTWATWESLGGCGLPNSTQVYKTLSPRSIWKKQGITLGDIQDACIYSGRSLARFAIDNLKIPSMVEIEYA